MNAVVLVRCRNCGADRRIPAGGVAANDYPMCLRCGVPMVVVQADVVPMKALSLRQPWAWAVISRGKRIDNRTWNTFFRGPLLIHAAKQCEEIEFKRALHWMHMRGVARVDDCPPLAELPRGGIVGRGRMVHVISPKCPLDAYPRGVDLRWHMHEQYGFVFEDVEPLPFRAYRGMPGLFWVEDAA